MTVHGNIRCEHTDATIAGVKKLQDAGDSHAVLEEIKRLRDAGLVTTELQSVVMTTHELGALTAAGGLTASDFMERIYALMPDILGAGGEHLLADVQIWCVQRLLAAKETEVDLARELVARFFDHLSVTPEMVVFEDIARVYLYRHEGNLEAAIELCRGCLTRVDRTAFPCIFECVSLDLARLLVRDGKPRAVRAVLRDSGLPLERIGEELAKLR